MTFLKRRDLEFIYQADSRGQVRQLKTDGLANNFYVQFNYIYYYKLHFPDC